MSKYSYLNPFNLKGKTSLDTTSLIYTSIGATLVVAGVVLKNSYEQSGKKDDVVGKYLGTALFVLGWALVAFATSVATGPHTLKTVLSIASVIGIITSVLIMKDQMSKGKKISKFLPILFAVSWLVLGYTLGMGHGKTNSAFTWNMHTTLGVMAAVLVLISMMYLLPKQRKSCIVDGPGMPIFVLGWVLVILANSLR